MANNVEFKDFSIQCKTALNEKTLAWLYEASGEIKSAAQRNSRVKTSDTKNSFDYQVDEGKGESQIGSPLENALWEEFGTGSYAINGDGRSGYWIFVKDGTTKSQNPKSYSLAEAKKKVAIMRSKGLDAYYTNGKKPSRALYNAFTSLQSKLVSRLESILKGMN